MKCAIEGCEKEVFRRDLCRKHYREAGPAPLLPDGTKPPQIAHQPHGKAGNPHPSSRMKHGQQNKITRQRIAEQAAKGILPLDAITKVMRDLVLEYDELMRLKPPAPKGRSTHKSHFERWRRAYLDWREMMGDIEERVTTIAARAAPYLHARLTSHKVQGEISLAEFDPKRLTDEQLYSLMGRIRVLIAEERRRALEGPGTPDDNARDGGRPPESVDGEPVRQVPDGPGEVHPE